MKDAKQTIYEMESAVMKEAKHAIIEAEVSAIQNWKGLAAAVFYGLMSASMAFFNKLLLDSYDFDFPYFIMLAQMFVTLLVMEALRLFKLIDIPGFTVERGKQFFIPSFFYALHSVLSLSALAGMNIAMYTVLKRCGPMLTLAFSVVILKKGRPNKLLILSVLLLTLGCIIATTGDLTFDLESYLYGVSSMFCQSIYLVTLQKQAVDFSTAETLHLASYNTTPLLLLLTVVFDGDFGRVLLSPSQHNIGFFLVFILVLTMGCLLNYSLFLCTTLNSALTTSIVGCIKSVLQVIVGAFTFEGASFNTPTVVGIFTNMAGGVVYTYSKAVNLHKSSGEMKRIQSLNDVNDSESAHPVGQERNKEKS